MTAGLRPPLAPDPFETLVSAITAQQVSLHAAFAIRTRFVQRFGRRAEQAYAFPTEQRLRRAKEEELVALGFSRRKAEYVLGVAAARLDYDGLAELPFGHRGTERGDRAPEAVAQAVVDVSAVGREHRAARDRASADRGGDVQQWQGQDGDQGRQRDHGEGGV